MSSLSTARWSTRRWFEGSCGRRSFRTASSPTLPRCHRKNRRPTQTRPRPRRSDLRAPRYAAPRNHSRCGEHRIGGTRLSNVADMAERPTISIPDTEPPSDLVIDDETVGDGDEAVAGKRVYVHYAGVAWSTGEQFDASWDRGDLFDFRLGAREVIEGWDKGVEGMRVGGRRRLTIPPHLGYGSRGAGGVIKGGETLVFVVDLVTVR